MKYQANKICLYAVLLSICMTSANLMAQNNAPPPARPALPAQVPPIAIVDPQLDWVTKFFEMKNVDAGEMKSILSIFRADLQVPNVSTGGTGKYRLLSVRAPKEIMPAIEDTIARFDVPPPPQPTRDRVKSIEVTVQVLGAYDGAAPSCVNCAISQSLQAVITQLQKTFNYKNYLLLDSQFYRQADFTSLSSVNSLATMSDNSATYTVSWTRALAAPDKSSVQLNSLKFGADVRMMGRDQSTHFGFDTSTVQIPADQQIVIGKTTVGANTVFLVIQAKVID